MDGLASGEHLNELLDSFGSRFVLFRRADAIEDGVAVALVSVPNISLARGLAVNASARSSGTCASACPAYAASQRPSSFARRTWSSPDRCIRPEAASLSARATFRFDQGL